MAIEPELSDPDWGRVLLSHGPLAPVGNPIRWGWVATTPLDQPIDADANGIVTYTTGPIVNAAAADGYARGWSIVGTLTMPLTTLYTTFSQPPVLAPGTYPRVATGGMNVYLDIVLGIGQISINQRIILMAGGAPTLGLCNQQAAVNAGPYAEIHSTDPIVSAVLVSRAFAAVSSIVANTISIRGIYELGGVGAKLPLSSVLSIGVAPFAAGTQL